MLVLNTVLISKSLRKNYQQEQKYRHKKQQNYPCAVLYRFEKRVGKIREHAACALRNGVNGHENLIRALHKRLHREIEAHCG